MNDVAGTKEKMIIVWEADSSQKEKKGESRDENMTWSKRGRNTSMAVMGADL